MKAGLFAFLAFVWIAGVLLGATYEKWEGAQWPLAAAETTPAGDALIKGSSGGGHTTFDYLLSMKNVVYQQEISVFGASLSFPMPNLEYFKTLGRVLMLRFDFLHGSYQIVWYLVLAPMAIGVMFILIYYTTQLMQGFIPFT